MPHPTIDTLVRRTRLRRLVPVVTAVVATTALAATATLAAGSALGATPVAAAPLRASSSPGGVPVTGARGAAAWLARQFVPGGYIKATSGGPDYSDTAQTVLALVAGGDEQGTVRSAMAFLRANVHHELTVDVGDKPVKDPGRIAYLLLDAHDTGGTGLDFGGVDLVTTLLATMRTSGSDAGLFGAATPDYDGAFRQGLSLAALVGAGAAPSRYAAAVRWLEGQQCASGGWQEYRADPGVACGPPDPKTYTGPDTNSTAVATEGLVAAGATMPTDPYAFLLDHQDNDGGWGYYAGPSDPDSTALVRQGLVALHKAHAHAVVKPGGTPRSALESFQLTTGPDAGALYYPLGNGSRTASLIATEQAGPALAGMTLPYEAHPGTEPTR